MLLPLQASDAGTRSVPDAAADATAAAQREAAQLKERLGQATNRMAQLEQKVGGWLDLHVARLADVHVCRCAGVPQLPDVDRVT